MYATNGNNRPNYADVEEALGVLERIVDVVDADVELNLVEEVVGADFGEEQATAGQACANARYLGEGRRLDAFEPAENDVLVVDPGEGGLLDAGPVEFRHHRAHEDLLLL